MRVLVIGGTGLTGPHIVQRLSELGHEIALFNRGKSKTEVPKEIQHIRGDLRNLLDYRQELVRFRPDVVLHMLAMSDTDAANVVRALRGIARRVVAISSQDVYRAYGRLIGIESGPIMSIPIGEDGRLRTRLFPYRERADNAEHLFYRYDKILVERRILGDPELPGTIIRYPMVYGTRDRQHRLHAYLKRMDDGRPAILLEDGQSRWRTTRGYSENVAAAAVLAVTEDQASGRVYNVGEADALSEADWVRAVGVAAGWEGAVVVVPSALLPQAMKPDYDTDQHLVTDTTRIRKELQFEEIVSREEGLLRTVAWERTHPPEDIDARRFDYAAEDAILKGLN